MNFDSQLLIYQYRNVVYLNNAATTFMARGEYEQAISSLKDALFLTETIVRPAVTSIRKTSRTKCKDFCRTGNDMFLQMSSPFIKDTQIKVQRVAQQLASYQHPISHSPLLLLVEVVCYDGSIDSSYSLAEQKKLFGSEQRVLAIHISDLLVDCKMDADEMHVNITEVVPAIILSNYALAHLCFFKATSNSNINALDGAMRLFHMSMKVLCIRDKLQAVSVNGSYGDHDDRYMYFTEGSLFVSLAISINIQCIPIETAIYFCSTSTSSVPITQRTSSCTIVQDLNTLQRFASEWIISTSYQVTVAICKVSTYGTNTATAA